MKCLHYMRHVYFLLRSMSGARVCIRGVCLLLSTHRINVLKGMQCMPPGRRSKTNEKVEVSKGKKQQQRERGLCFFRGGSCFFLKALDVRNKGTMAYTTKDNCVCVSCFCVVAPDMSPQTRTDKVNTMATFQRSRNSF